MSSPSPLQNQYSINRSTLFSQVILCKVPFIFYSRSAAWAKCGAGVDVGKRWDKCGCGQKVDRILICITIPLYATPDMRDGQNVGLMLMWGKHGINEDKEERRKLEFVRYMESQRRLPSPKGVAIYTAT